MRECDRQYTIEDTSTMERLPICRQFTIGIKIRAWHHRKQLFGLLLTVPLLHWAVLQFPLPPGRKHARRLVPWILDLQITLLPRGRTILLEFLALSDASYNPNRFAFVFSKPVNIIRWKVCILPLASIQGMTVSGALLRIGPQSRFSIAFRFNFLYIDGVSFMLESSWRLACLFINGARSMRSPIAKTLVRASDALVVVFLYVRLRNLDELYIQLIVVLVLTTMDALALPAL
jgi:hypothetical protein